MRKRSQRLWLCQDGSTQLMGESEYRPAGSLRVESWWGTGSASPQGGQRAERETPASFKIE